MLQDHTERRDFLKRIATGAAVAMPVLGAESIPALSAQSQTVRPAPTPFNVAEFGAVGDGRTLCTAAIQKAVDACAGAGGGKVVFPAGRFLTGPIFLKSHVHVEIPEGTTLLGLTDFGAVPSVRTRWEGIDREVYASMFTGVDLENIAVTGRGTLDGQGEAWWKAFQVVTEMRKQAGLMEREPENPPGSPLKWARPRMINLYRCRHVLISGIRVLNSPSWNIHPILCDDVILDQLTILSPDNAPNTDGIDPDSCRNLRISNCYISVGDDCITIKSGYRYHKENVASENLTIANCVFARGHGGVGVGSETAGGVRNVTVSNCICEGTDRGLRFKTARGRGNTVENFRAQNVVMRGVTDAISVTMLYGGADLKKAEPVSETTPVFRNIHLSEIVATEVKRAVLIEGLPEMPVQGISISNLVAEGELGIVCTNAQGVSFDNIGLTVRKGPAVSVAQTKGVEFYRLTSQKPVKDQPVVRFENVTDALFQSCKAVEGTGTFLELKGTGNREITMFENRLTKSAKAIDLVEGATDSSVVRK
jgi:polygalacturonase